MKVLEEHFQTAYEDDMQTIGDDGGGLVGCGDNGTEDQSFTLLHSSVEVYLGEYAVPSADGGHDEEDDCHHGC